MTDWVLWLVAAGLLVAVEIFSGTFYLLMLALGCAAGGLIALAGWGLAFQFAGAGIAGTAATLLLAKSRFGMKKLLSSAHDPSVNLDIGNVLAVHEWQTGCDGARYARVSYRGAMWDVAPGEKVQVRPGRFVIREIRSNCLIVENAPE
ncbi:MAG: hypothetical protein NC211_05040 [Alistipes senegalensis]|nr:NfeD family protein [Oxalobacter formigenes]MCM1281182.1 hypothetical protein [Alistipes senegalensis]